MIKRYTNLRLLYFSLLTLRKSLVTCFTARSRTVLVNTYLIEDDDERHAWSGVVRRQLDTFMGLGVRRQDM